MTLRRSSNRPTDVYRLYDADGRLLYVGISTNGYARLERHRRERPWWPAVRRVRVEQYRDRMTALEVEAHAIRDEQPIHNLAANTLYTHESGRTLLPLQIDDFEVA